LIVEYYSRIGENKTARLQEHLNYPSQVSIHAAYTGSGKCLHLESIRGQRFHTILALPDQCFTLLVSRFKEKMKSLWHFILSAVDMENNFIPFTFVALLCMFVVFENQYYVS